MHADEHLTDVPLVQQLLAAQFPEWAALPIERVPSSGTDNALYRLGDDMVVRLPRIKWATAGIGKDFGWLPLLAPLLPVAIPSPLARGRPGSGYPWEWGVYTWLGGQNPEVGAGSEAIARDVADLLRSLRRVDLPNPPACRRGKPLASQNDQTRKALDGLEGLVDAELAAAVWDEALALPDWAGPALWLHGDLLPGNLLVQGGRLTGVIDFAVMGVGDPSCDLIPAWSVFEGDARDLFRREVEVDDFTWARGRAWALSIGLGALPYYRETNPAFAAVAQHMISQVLAEPNVRS